jgi:hypothetical protein
VNLKGLYLVALGVLELPLCKLPVLLSVQLPRVYEVQLGPTDLPHLTACLLAHPWWGYIFPLLALAVGVLATAKRTSDAVLLHLLAVQSLVFLACAAVAVVGYFLPFV